MSQQQQSKDQTKERSHESREQRNERKKASPKQPSGQVSMKPTMFSLKFIILGLVWDCFGLNLAWFGAGA